MPATNQLSTASTAYKPFIYPHYVDAAAKHDVIFWHEKEVSLGDDVEQWNNGTISDEEKRRVTQVLRVFTQMDAEVASNYCDLWIPYFKNNEVRMALLSIAHREGVHMRAYSLLNDTLGLPDSDYSKFREYLEMSEKIDFISTDVRDRVVTDIDMAMSIHRTVFSEGILLFAAFAMLLSPNRFGRLRGVSTIAEWSLRDESQHVAIMSKLARDFRKEKSLDEGSLESFTQTLVRDAVATEDMFINLVYSESTDPDLSSDDLKQYIRYIADIRMTQLGYEKVFNVSNPLGWIDMQLMEGLTNFFEGTTTEYQAGGGLVGEWGW